MIAEELAAAGPMGKAEAIERQGLRVGALECLINGMGASLDSFQNTARISLELLENSAFPFASRERLQYRRAPHHRWASLSNDRLFLQRA